MQKIEFDAENTDRDNFPIYFLAGLNGTGKSAFLETVALIFSRISQNELPGFAFEVSYELFIEGERVVVTVCPEKNREWGRLHIETGDEVFHSFENHEKYLPYKVFVCVSGQNSQMGQLVLDAAKDSIFSDIYDAGMTEQPEEIGQLVRYLEELQQNPRVLYLDEEIAGLVLFVLCAWRPREGSDYIKLRERLLQKLGNGFYPRVLSITAKRERITAAYCVTGKKRNFCAERIAERYVSPLTLLITLLQAKNSGEMQECHVLYQREEGSDLLTERSLSYGELLWVGRMGLVLLARQMEADNCLFLLDEPDVHLNESWNIDFVSYE